MKYLAYIVGILAALGCIVFPLATHASTNATVAMICFGVALLAAMILMVVWNESGTVSPSGDTGYGLKASFALDGWQWVVIALIVGAGVAAAVIAGSTIHS